MRRFLSAILLIILTVNLIAIIFTFRQVSQEEASLSVDLQRRSALLAESLKDTIEPYVIGQSDTNLQRVVEKFAHRERLLGIAVYNTKDKLIAFSSGLQKQIPQSQSISAAAMDEDKDTYDFIKLNNQRLYLYAIPLHDDKRVIGSMMLVENASYIDTILRDVWMNNIIRVLIYTFLSSLITLIIFRWVISQPMSSIVKLIKSARTGEGGTEEIIPSNHFFFQPLINEVSNISKTLLEARSSASLEARLRLEKLDSPWTAERLKELTKDLLKDRKIIVVANREPYIHSKKDNKITFMQPASGMVTAIEPILRACSGVWVAHGSGNADKLVVDENDRVKVPPDDPKYTLRRVWLTKEEEKGYYYGFSNEGIWPLCHMVHTKPIFRKEDWIEYQNVNKKFAQALLKEMKGVERPLIFIQDYHFTLLPKLIKEKRPDAIIAIFWHVPWPNSEYFRICPWRKEILEGMLGADLIGFHTQLHCNNFIDTVGRELEALINLEQFSIQKEGHVSYVKPFPISIPYTEEGNETSAKVQQKLREDILKKLDIHAKYIGIGVDRMDYTKGILERFKAIEYFLEKYPTYKGQFTFIQIAPASRSMIPQYQKFAEEVEKETERINNKFKKRNWKPIVLLKQHHTHGALNKLYKIANVCIVTSLHDGMNLVAKEFIIARDDEQGVLILSQFAGASRELGSALIVNPYSTEETADIIRQALKMTHAEQKRRMSRLRETVKNYNVYRWSAELLKTLVSLES